MLRDVVDGKVSAAAARDDYGVALETGVDVEAPRVDEVATNQLRERLRAARPDRPAIIDRGDGYEKMLHGEFKPWKRSA